MSCHLAVVVAVRRAKCLSRMRSQARQIRIKIWAVTVWWPANICGSTRHLEIAFRQISRGFQPIREVWLDHTFNPTKESIGNPNKALASARSSNEQYDIDKSL
jgi:hypothetical protein